MTNKEAAELSKHELEIRRFRLVETKMPIDSAINFLNEIQRMLDHDLHILNGDDEGETYLEDHEVMMMRETLKGIASMVYHVKASFGVR